MDIGFAAKALLDGKKVARAGWNGMYVVLIAGEAVTLDGGHAYAVQRCIGLRTTGNTMQPGWNASTQDVLAQDWELVT